MVQDNTSDMQAKELHANIVHLGSLSKFFKRAYRELFLTSDTNDNKQSTISSDSMSVSNYYRFGWLLFLALRTHAFGRIKDLVTCTNGLVSILAVLIIHMPVHLKNFSSSDCQWFVKKDDKGLDLLASLCNKYNTSEEELRRTLEKTNDLIASILKKTPCCASDCKNEILKDINADSLIYYEDLLEESSLKSSLTILEKDYDDANKGELDEKMFINEEDGKLDSDSLSAELTNISGSKRKIDFLSSPVKPTTSPHFSHRSPASYASGIPGCSKMAATPVSTAMTTAKWLWTVISPLPSKPSAQMESFLASCDRDVTADITRRAHIILEAIFPSSPRREHSVTGSLQRINLMDNIWTEQRRVEALKLYYKVLEAMCTAESQKLQTTNLTSLLTNERFHRCMLACAAELVLATHKTVTMLFPAVLDRTGITAFDFSKVIEGFIRHEDSMPRELRRHLNSLEEKLLESMVWEKGSSMYNSLIVSRPVLFAEINSLGLLAEPMPSLDAIAVHIKDDISSGQIGDVRSPKRLCTDYRIGLVERSSFTTPVKDRLLALSNVKSKQTPPALQSAFASPTCQNPGGGGETSAETGISIFFNKICKLAAIRINGMVERLHQSHQHIRENVYCFFQKILSQQTSLFFNRHIDQIILCCFYGISKIFKINLTFKEIIGNYKKQPQCKPQVFQTVFVDRSSADHNGRSGHGHVDIITFYNEIFIPSVKPLLMGVASAEATMKTNQVPEGDNNKEVQCPASPRVPPFPSLPDMSPKKVSATHNVYVSPLRRAKMDALISHSSKSFYACVGESTHAFQSPSKDLSDINNHLKSNRKGRALNFDNASGLVSDSVVASSLFQQNGICASSSGAAPLKTEEPFHNSPSLPCL